ncbi:hypothetical protein B0O80DRAFT_185246 [Mortierella sp. GBAus27b]|nr:hypothetical protein B0O80DRAFT_185246 [Mortierella sp. GBAus27b]
MWISEAPLPTLLSRLSCSLMTTCCLTGCTPSQFRPCVSQEAHVLSSCPVSTQLITKPRPRRFGGHYIGKPQCPLHVLPVAAKDPVLAKAATSEIDLAQVLETIEEGDKEGGPRRGRGT